MRISGALMSPNIDGAALRDVDSVPGSEKGLG